MDIQKLLKNLTVEEKAALVAGTDFMHTNPVPRLDIPSICMADGPHGLRKQTGASDNGISQSEPATAFPTAVTTASGWNPDNTKRMGAAIAEECAYYGVNILLGPGTNIKRNPLCGRNFEYFSEDPYLAGEMAAAEVQGVQSKGVGVSVKHFALNNSENFRFMGDSVADERAIREIYLKPFEKVVKQARPFSIMCAYNKINGTYCSENKQLLSDILRDEWGFDGLVMTDWGAMHNRVKSLQAGLDLEMPGDTAVCRKWIVDGIKDGSLSAADLDKAAENVLNLVDKTSKNGDTFIDFAAHNALSAEIAEDCAVLLKNDGNLPLEMRDSLYIVGDLFEKMRYQGAGSSMINPTEVTSPKTAFDKRGVKYQFARGYAESKLDPQPELIAEAVEKSKDYDKIIVFAGLTDYVESEGADRDNMCLPQNQLALIDELINTGKKIIVVLFGGSVIELPFADKVSAILNMFLPGQNGGTACANLLFGDKTPCGKLAETWVESYADVPFGDEYSKTVNEVYKESIFVGYRYYASAKKQVRYPFGYGLSYTKFAYDNLKIEWDGKKIAVKCALTNVGGCGGAEVVQLYVKAPRSDIFKPEKELRAFAKVYLIAGESKQVTLEVDNDDLRYFDIKQRRWILEGGEYDFQVCSDCLTVRLSEKIKIEGENTVSPYSDAVIAAYSGLNLQNVTDKLFEDMSGQSIPALPPQKPITLESRFTDLQSTFTGRILFKAVLSMANKQAKKAQKMQEGPEKDNCTKGAMFLKRVLESNSLNSMSMCAGKSFPYNFARGFMELSNGHILRGIMCFCKKIKVSKLPKEENK